MINRQDDQDYFRFEARHSGTVTVSLDADDHFQPQLGSSVATPANDSLRMSVLAGQSYEFYVTSLSGIGRYRAQLQLRPSNDIRVSDRSVQLLGTPSDDQFEVSLGATYTVSINGVSYSFSPTEVNDIRIAAGQGHDHLRVVGSDGHDDIVLRYDGVELAAKDVTVVARSVEESIVEGGGGTDTATFHDSPGDDWLTAYQDNVSLAGDRFRHRVLGVGKVHAYSVSGGTDRAYLHDSALNDSFEAWPRVGHMRAASFTHSVHSFARVYAYADQGGDDRAVLHDSWGDDNFVSYPDYGRLSGTEFSIWAQAFEQVEAIAENGGIDRAFLYDSDGDDVFTSAADASSLTGPGFSNRAVGFERVYGYASRGLDAAYLHDSTEDDLVRSTANTIRLDNSGYARIAERFDRVSLDATAGGRDRAKIVGGTGSERPRLVLLSQQAYLTSIDALMSMRGIESWKLDAGIEQLLS
jgi:hypothetical protein